MSLPILKSLKKSIKSGEFFSQANKFLDGAVSLISPKWAFQRQAYRNAINAASTQYVGAARTDARGDWNVMTGMQSSSTPPNYELSVLRDRSRDENRNSPIATAMTGTMSMNVAGTGLQLQSKLRADALGISEDQADDYRRRIEDVFDIWSRTPDASGILDFDEMQFVTVGKIVEDGESIALPVWRNPEWRTFGRAIQLIESDRLQFASSKASGQKLPDGRMNDTGIFLGPFGEPKSYSIRKANSLTEYEEIDVRDSDGRPKIIHNFRTLRPGQVRGVPLMAPIMTMLKDLSGVMDATVMRARVAACLSVIFTKQNPLDAMMGQASAGFDKTKASSRMEELFPGMIHYAGLGETATMLDPAPDGSSFDPFVSIVIKLCCASIGLPYELIIKDFSKTNYSSARAAILEGRRVFTNWRKWMARKFCQPIFELILEEAYLLGLLKLPKFDQFRHEYSRALWIGGGWGWVDPVKEIEASNMAIESGLSTLADECAANGKDWEENLGQRKREIPREREAGVLRNAPGNVVEPGPAQQETPQQARRKMILTAAMQGEI